ncbi:serine arginine repetitive matrix protein 2 (pre-mrna splicing) [Cystoisospora suis]|uniref:Serine arginine repetitive matrix protein 2 (Pre-mrna splicing) n=1 Tax=Cystoisospora suis TaxID=483139 RepID=A0A2C6KI19_9APIC|nr:serine arginine repetitive matrix protein 2 (pre-mrna splicing) [Cystoisospora suis]
MPQAPRLQDGRSLRVLQRVPLKNPRRPAPFDSLTDRTTARCPESDETATGNADENLPYLQERSKWQTAGQPTHTLASSSCPDQQGKAAVGPRKRHAHGPEMERSSENTMLPFPFCESDKAIRGPVVQSCSRSGSPRRRASRPDESTAQETLRGLSRKVFPDQRSCRLPRAELPPFHSYSGLRVASRQRLGGDAEPDGHSPSCGASVRDGHSLDFAARPGCLGATSAEKSQSAGGGLVGDLGKQACQNSSKEPQSSNRRSRQETSHSRKRTEGSRPTCSRARTAASDWVFGPPDRRVYPDNRTTHDFPYRRTYPTRVLSAWEVGNGNQRSVRHPTRGFADTNSRTGSFAERIPAETSRGSQSLFFGQGGSAGEGEFQAAPSWNSLAGDWSSRSPSRLQHSQSAARDINQSRHPQCFSSEDKDGRLDRCLGVASKPCLGSSEPGEVFGTLQELDNRCAREAPYDTSLPRHQARDSAGVEVKKEAQKRQQRKGPEGLCPDGKHRQKIAGAHSDNGARRRRQQGTEHLRLLEGASVSELTDVFPHSRTNRDVSDKATDDSARRETNVIQQSGQHRGENRDGRRQNSESRGVPPPFHRMTRSECLAFHGQSDQRQEELSNEGIEHRAGEDDAYDERKSRNHRFCIPGSKSTACTEGRHRNDTMTRPPRSAVRVVLRGRTGRKDAQLDLAVDHAVKTVDGWCRNCTKSDKHGGLVAEVQDKGVNTQALPSESDQDYKGANVEASQSCCFPFVPDGVSPSPQGFLFQQTRRRLMTRRLTVEEEHAVACFSGTCEGPPGPCEDEGTTSVECADTHTRHPSKLPYSAASSGEVRCASIPASLKLEGGRCDKSPTYSGRSSGHKERRLHPLDYAGCMKERGYAMRSSLVRGNTRGEEALELGFRHQKSQGKSSSEIYVQAVRDQKVNSVRVPGFGDDVDLAAPRLVKVFRNERACRMGGLAREPASSKQEQSSEAQGDVPAFHDSPLPVLRGAGSYAGSVRGALDRSASEPSERRYSRTEAASGSLAKTFQLDSGNETLQCAQRREDREKARLPSHHSALYRLKKPDAVFCGKASPGFFFAQGSSVRGSARSASSCRVSPLFETDSLRDQGSEIMCCSSMSCTDGRYASPALAYVIPDAAYLCCHCHSQPRGSAACCETAQGYQQCEPGSVVPSDQCPIRARRRSSTDDSTEGDNGVISRESREPLVRAYPGDSCQNRGCGWHDRKSDVMGRTLHFPGCVHNVHKNMSELGDDGDRCSRHLILLPSPESREEYLNSDREACLRVQRRLHASFHGSQGANGYREKKLLQKTPIACEIEDSRHSTSRQRSAQSPPRDRQSLVRATASKFRVGTAQGCKLEEQICCSRHKDFSQAPEVQERDRRGYAVSVRKRLFHGDAHPEKSVRQSESCHFAQKREECEENCGLTTMAAGGGLAAEVPFRKNETVARRVIWRGQEEEGNGHVHGRGQLWRDSEESLSELESKGRPLGRYYSNRRSSRGGEGTEKRAEGNTINRAVDKERSETDSSEDETQKTVNQHYTCDGSDYSHEESCGEEVADQEGVEADHCPCCTDDSFLHHSSFEAVLPSGIAVTREHSSQPPYAETRDHTLHRHMDSVSGLQSEAVDESFKYPANPRVEGRKVPRESRDGHMSYKTEPGDVSVLSRCRQEEGRHQFFSGYRRTESYGQRGQAGTQEEDGVPEQQTRVAGEGCVPPPSGDGENIALETENQGRESSPGSGTSQARNHVSSALRTTSDDDEREERFRDRRAREKLENAIHHVAVGVVRYLKERRGRKEGMQEAKQTQTEARGRAAGKQTNEDRERRGTDLSPEKLGKHGTKKRQMASRRVKETPEEAVNLACRSSPRIRKRVGGGSGKSIRPRRGMTESEEEDVSKVEKRTDGGKRCREPSSKRQNDPDLSREVHKDSDSEENETEQNTAKKDAGRRKRLRTWRGMELNQDRTTDTKKRKREEEGSDEEKNNERGGELKGQHAYSPMTRARSRLSQLKSDSSRTKQDRGTNEKLCSPGGQEVCSVEFGSRGERSRRLGCTDTVDDKLDSPRVGRRDGRTATNSSHSPYSGLQEKGEASRIQRRDLRASSILLSMPSHCTSKAVQRRSPRLAKQRHGQSQQETHEHEENASSPAEEAKAGDVTSRSLREKNRRDRGEAVKLQDKGRKENRGSKTRPRRCEEEVIEDEVDTEDGASREGAGIVGPESYETPGAVNRGDFTSLNPASPGKAEKKPTFLEERGAPRHKGRKTKERAPYPASGRRDRPSRKVSHDSAGSSERGEQKGSSDRNHEGSSDPRPTTKVGGHRSEQAQSNSRVSVLPVAQQRGDLTRCKDASNVEDLPNEDTFAGQRRARGRGRLPKRGVQEVSEESSAVLPSSTTTASTSNSSDSHNEEQRQKSDGPDASSSSSLPAGPAASSSGSPSVRRSTSLFSSRDASPAQGEDETASPPVQVRSLGAESLSSSLFPLSSPRNRVPKGFSVKERSPFPDRKESHPSHSEQINEDPEEAGLEDTSRSEGNTQTETGAAGDQEEIQSKTAGSVSLVPSRRVSYFPEVSSSDQPQPELVSEGTLQSSLSVTKKRSREPPQVATTPHREATSSLTRIGGGGPGTLALQRLRREQLGSIPSPIVNRIRLGLNDRISSFLHPKEKRGKEKNEERPTCMAPVSGSGLQQTSSTLKKSGISLLNEEVEKGENPEEKGEVTRHRSDEEDKENADEAQGAVPARAHVERRTSTTGEGEQEKSRNVGEVVKTSLDSTFGGTEQKSDRGTLFSSPPANTLNLSSSTEDINLVCPQSHSSPPSSSFELSCCPSSCSSSSLGTRGPSASSSSTSSAPATSPSDFLWGVLGREVRPGDLVGGRLVRRGADVRNRVFSGTLLRLINGDLRTTTEREVHLFITNYCTEKGLVPTRSIVNGKKMKKWPVGNDPILRILFGDQCKAFPSTKAEMMEYLRRNKHITYFSIA